MKPTTHTILSIVRVLCSILVLTKVLDETGVFTTILFFLLVMLLEIQNIQIVALRKKKEQKE